MQCYIRKATDSQAINKPFTFALPPATMGYGEQRMTDRGFVLSLVAIVLVVAAGSVLDVMEVDAAQYAGMSRDMLVRGDVLKLYFRGEDYLDKPPLLFWLSALSFKVFGVHDWSYRLPSILFALLGLFSTYRFAALYHGTTVARTATLFLGSSAAFFLMTNDVRCDTILMGSVITAIWLGCAWLEQGRSWQLAGSAIAIAAGLLAKGPIGGLAPLIAVGCQLLFTRDRRRLHDRRLITVPFLVVLLLLPMCIGLYQQHGVHGLRFYFWEQSFGRITGENRWKDDSSVFFFTHEVLWQLLPWTVFVLVGLWKNLRSLTQRQAIPEIASWVGAVLVFVALSLSHFKLPHYLYVIVPLLAVQGAIGFHSVGTRSAQWVHAVTMLLLWCSILLLTWVTFPEGQWPFIALLGAMLIAAVVSIGRRGIAVALVSASFWVMIAVGLTLNVHFYPNLLRYQANAAAGHWAAEQVLGPGRFFGMQVSGSALDYYAGYPVPWLSDAKEAHVVIAPGVVIYTDAEHRKQLVDAGLRPVTEVVFQNYSIQLLGLRFLRPHSRDEQLTPRYLLLY